MSPPATELAARSIPLTDGELPDDLGEWAGDNGFLFRDPRRAFAGRGIALRVPIAGGVASLAEHDPVTPALRALEGSCPGEVPPLAVTALPFHPEEEGCFLVPSVLIRRDAAGGASMTLVAPRDDLDQLHLQARLSLLEDPGRGAPALPDAFELIPTPPHREWSARVHDAVAAIRAGDVDKVVLAREVTVRANQPLRAHQVTARLSQLYPTCTVFSIEGFVGASPELLLRRDGAAVSSHPLAGTVPHSGDRATDDRAAGAMLASSKQRHEHDLAVRAVADILRRHCADLAVPEAPTVLSLRNVSHLATLLEGTLSGGAEGTPILPLLSSLHPTPAVAGSPRGPALEWIAKLEGGSRGRYAGPVGWCDARGDGEFVLGIRSALIDGPVARLFAGVGIVGDSEPEEELTETQLKLQALLAAIVRP